MEVEPVRDMKDVKRMYEWLNETYTPREAECFLIGCNIALRAGDLLTLRFDILELQRTMSKRWFYRINLIWRREDRDG